MKKTVSEKTTPEKAKTKEVAQTKTDDHFTIRVPRLKFKDGSLNVYLVFVLVMFSFLLGMLTNKVLYLEKELKGTSTPTTAVATDDSANAYPTVPPAPEFVDVEEGHLPVLGDADAPITIVEFSDLQCPFCKAYVDDTHQQIIDKYVDSGQVKIAFRHFPLNSIHPNAQLAAEAAECANEQDAFWDFHDKLFETQDDWTYDTNDDAKVAFAEYAGELSLNTTQFTTCLDDEKYADNVSDDLSAGSAAQVDGTPAFFINGQRLVGAQPFSEFERVIEEQLNQ